MEDHKLCPKCNELKEIAAFMIRANGRADSWCRKCTNKAGTAYFQRHPEKRRNQNLKYNHRITNEEYDAMFAKQNGVCASCGLPASGVHYEKPRKLAVDHCHKTGQIRGLLCDKCNRALGYLDDDPEKIKGLLRYIMESEENRGII